jgi:spore maturation protein CgeB
MRICIIGKIGSVTHWLEDCAAGCTAAGHDVRICPTRNPKLNPAIEELLLLDALGTPRASWIARAVKRFRPDFILTVKGFDVPAEILDRLKSLPGRPPIAAWVGDAFGEADRTTAAYYDLVAYTDSFFVAQHAASGFASRCIYLPHAANNRLSAQAATVRAPRLVFVGNPTPNRVDLLARLETPIEIYGPGWQSFSSAPHAIHAGRIDVPALAAVYCGHIGVLNMRSEGNVVHGLNQRSFDPYLLGTPVVSDDQPDLKNCFEEGREVLVWRSVDELAEICRRLGRQPDIALEIGAAGRRRVLAEHCYGHRIARIAAALS